MCLPSRTCPWKNQCALFPVTFPLFSTRNIDIIEHLEPCRGGHQPSDDRATKQKEPGTLWSRRTSPGLLKLNYQTKWENINLCLVWTSVTGVTAATAFSALSASPLNPVPSLPTARTFRSRRKVTLRPPALPGWDWCYIYPILPIRLTPSLQPWLMEVGEWSSIFLSLSLIVTAVRYELSSPAGAKTVLPGAALEPCCSHAWPPASFFLPSPTSLFPTRFSWNSSQGSYFPGKPQPKFCFWGIQPEAIFTENM